MNNYTIEDFFKENEYKITNGGATLNPPIYYQSLNDAFTNYFNTVRNNKNTYHFQLDFKEGNNSVINFHNIDSAVFTILGFHRFFELLLKDILTRINPLLAFKFPINEKESILFLNQELELDKMETVEFSKAFQRFKEALKYSIDNPENTQYLIVQKFSFLKEGETLNKLSTWRNRIMHNGKTLPNIYLLDYFISQSVIPLINEVIKVDSDTLKEYKPHYFKTLSGINIIEEILNIKIDYKDFKKETPKKELAEKYLKLAHLKELGRASVTVDPYIKNNIVYDSPYYNDPISRNIRFALQEKNHESFYSHKKCPCCGYDTLVVYRKEIDEVITQKKGFISWFNCYTCTYSLKNNIGDPNYFGYSEELLFATE